MEDPGHSLLKLMWGEVCVGTERGGEERGGEDVGEGSNLL